MKKELVDIVRKLRSLDIKAETYINRIPTDINMIFFDNEYVNNIKTQKDLLINTLFGDMAEDINWFLYEFTAGKSLGPHCITSEGFEYTYHTDEDYYNYLENCK